MKKSIYFILLIAWFTCVNAQSSSVDKNKVLDFFQNQQFDEAISYLLPAAGIDSQNVQLLSYLGYANYMNDNLTAAEKYYGEIFKIDSNNLTAVQYLAIIFRNDNLDKALFFTNRMVHLQPYKATHYRNLSELFRRKNNKDSAFFYIGAAYKISPGDYRNGAGLADMLIDSKSFSEANRILETGLQQDSLNSNFLKLRVRSGYEANDYKSVIIPGERLIRLGETYIAALTQLVFSYYNLKMYSDCIRVCDYMLFKELDVESIYYYEAKAWAKLNNFSKSNDFLQTCIAKSISKNAEMYYYSLGQNYEALKKYKKAVSNYDTAYYLFKNPVMIYNCGRICETNLKDMGLAQKYYTKYLANANPHETDEQKAYEYVKARWGRKNSAAKKVK